MPILKPYGSVRVDYLRVAAEALRCKAHQDAAHSSGRESFEKEDTYDWEASIAIDAAVVAACMVPNPSTPSVKCAGCGSVGFSPSRLGAGRCSFCDGTEAGVAHG